MSTERSPLMDGGAFGRRRRIVFSVPFPDSRRCYGRLWWWSLFNLDKIEKLSLSLVLTQLSSKRKALEGLWALEEASYLERSCWQQSPCSVGIMGHSGSVQGSSTPIHKAAEESVWEDSIEEKSKISQEELFLYRVVLKFYFLFCKKYS